MSCEGCGGCATAAPTKGRRRASRGSSGKHAEADFTIALLGQPNSGKSTLFNGLTGARQHVGNWPGKTVEHKSGAFCHNGRTFEVVDLPGAYGLDAASPEEEVTRDFIARGETDAVVVFADASQLERSLYMLASFAGTETPAVLVLNLMDVAKSQGKTIDAALLEKRLGIPVLPLVATERKSYPDLHEAIGRALDSAEGDADSNVGSDAAASAGTDKKANIEARPSHLLSAGVPGTEGAPLQKQAAARFRWFESLLDGVVEAPEEQVRSSLFDRIAIGSRWSKPLALFMILLGFMLAFIPAFPIMGIGGAVSSLGIEADAALAAAGAPEILGSFLSGVVFNSLCFGIMMVGYVFGINLVFGIYEDVGYMARISYVFDSTMARFGLQGKSLMPFLMCFGCTMGGVSGSRVIDTWGQRMLTVAMAWAIPCGSTWGVVPVIAVAFFGFGAPAVIALIFVVCILLMWTVGKLFGPRLVDKDERAGLVMELPPYHKLHLGNVVRNACLKSWQMFKRAIRVVALFAFAIWALTFTATGAVEGSLLYVIGTAIEPVTLFFGLTWQTFTAWLCGLVLKESALGVLSALFVGTGTPNAALIGAATGAAVVAGNLGDALALSITAPQALAFIFAFTFNMPCAASVSATYGEIHSAKWTAILAVFYIGMSLLLGCVVYHVSSLFL